jgi:hypothetical protein
LQSAALQAKKAVYGYVKMQFQDVADVQTTFRCTYKNPQNNIACNAPVVNGKCTVNQHTCNQPAKMLQLVTQYNDEAGVSQIFESTIGSEEIFPSVSKWEVGLLNTCIVCFHYC